MKSNENKLIGGKSDKLSLQNIADKFNVSIEEIKTQLQKGIKVEMEHTYDKEKATEIATDHISEFPDYYNRLEKMENKAYKEIKTNKMNENKILIKRLLHEELEEGKFGRMAGTLGMAAASMMSPKMQANSPKPPIEHSKEEEKVGVTRNPDGTYTSTVITMGPTEDLAKNLAIEKAKNQILEKLRVESGNVVNVKIMKIKTSKANDGKINCMITITATVE